MQTLYSMLPRMDSLLTHPLLNDFDKSRLKPLIRSKLDKLRSQILSQSITKDALESAIKSLVQDILQSLQMPTIPNALDSHTLVPVINATGIIVQTNLGRSVFSNELLTEIAPFLHSYHTLEYDLKSGKRGNRYKHTTQILQEMLGCEDALVVNNNAAAVLLILHTFANDKEVIISRGELVEIGGGFRIPEVMKCAGAILREVGTTNKTHLDDYKNVISEKTAIIMKAHQSNFTQSGFVKHCSMRELSHLAQMQNLIDYYDLGSVHLGNLINQNTLSLQDILSHKPSLVSFSGDKLLGGPQCGIIIGKSALIKKLKSNQLLRSLRVDKFTILALIATLKAYKDGAYHKIPTFAMLKASAESLRKKAKQFSKLLFSHIKKQQLQTYMKCEIVPLSSLAGGGSLPNVNLDSFGLKITPLYMNATSLATNLRLKGVIANIQKESVLFDVRTIFERDLEYLAQILADIIASHKESNDE